MTVARWIGGFLRRNPSRSPRPVWLRLLRHTVRIDSSCAHVSTCGPHSKLCATKRGPPCKQGATISTLHFLSVPFKIFLVHVSIEVQEIDSCSLFPLVCRPSGFTQNAMRYPPRSPDITIEPQAKTTVQTWILGPFFTK